MLNQYFTFDELQKEYNFNIASREIKVRVRAAYNRKIYILPAFKKQQTYYEMATKQEVDEWCKNPTPISGKDEGKNYREILDKYNLSNAQPTKKDFIKFMKDRGIEVELDTNFTPPIFKVINDDIFTYDWVPYPADKDYEVCREGFVRATKGKRICGSTSGRDGYVIINNQYNNKGQHTAHRMIKETFDPIENSYNFVVDHINGIRNDNRLENLRWCYQAQNIRYKEENLNHIKELIPKCIQKYGYQEFENILTKLL